jgi:hypothetical protein
MASSWTSLSNLPTLPTTFQPNTMVLLSDGTVMVHNTMQSDKTGAATAGWEWFRLTPDDKGDYDTGTWAGPFNMATARQFFASAVLKDGRLFVLGGEYSSAGGDTALGEIFDPQTNSWSTMTTPAAFNWINGDAVSVVLGDGRVIFGALQSSRTAIWDPITDDWREAGLGFGASIVPSKVGRTDEETWTLLPDGTVLAVEISATPSAEKYDPATDLWVPADQTPATLTQALALMNLMDTTVPPPQPSINISEIGPALVLPNGTLFAIGATGHTAIYTPPASPSQPGSWAAGPDLPADTSTAKFNNVNGNLQTAIDAPAVLLPGGKVLLMAGNTVREVDSGGNVSFWSNPSNVYVYDPVANTTPTLLSPQPPTNGNDTWTARFLLLPNAKVFFTGEQSALQMLTPDASLTSPDASWKPTITDAPSQLVTDHTYVLTGRQFNGLSTGSVYGDDAQMASNFPIVRLTNTSSGKVSYLRSTNFSNQGIATGNTLVTTEINVPHGLADGAYNLQVIANAIASDPFPVHVSSRDCFLQFDRSTYAQGEIQSMINANGAPAVIDPAAFVIVEGFTPGELGLTASNLGHPPNKPSIPDSAAGFHFVFSGPVLPEDPGLPNSPQRFTFPFKAVFDNADGTGSGVFNLGASSVPLAVNASLTAGGTTVAGSGNVILTKNPNPFILHGDVVHGYPWYLSVDIKTFQVKAGSHRFNTPVPNTGNARADATGYIQTIIGAFNGDRASAASLFDALSLYEDPTTITLAPTAIDGTPVFNFVLARIRYRDTIPANNVRCFFRMWPAQQTNATYGSPTTLYRSAPTAGGQVIPLLGVQGDEIMTIPFFATPRVHAESTASMTTQTDSPNVQAMISPSTLGGEVDSYFGAWLDINQPAEKVFPVRMVGGALGAIPDGPFTGMGQLLSIQELVRSEHQCLLCEVSFDLDPIPGNADPSNNDKLAQRNLTFGAAPNPGLEDSRRVPQTFEIRPTPHNLRADLRPDELMIDWGKVPRDAVAQIYLPAVLADEILGMAADLYTTHRLSKVDGSTLACPTGGVTYIPIPRSAGPNFAGLLTVSLPLGIRQGDVYDVTVRQVTSSVGRVPSTRGTQVALGRTTATAVGIATVKGVTEFQWRRTLGVFHLRIPISTKHALLRLEERRLSIMRHIGKAILITDRWYKVFHRLLDQLAGRVRDMGGDPSKVVPDPNGNWDGQIPDGSHGKGASGEERVSSIGKVWGVVYDRFGDFEGFVLDTEDGQRRFDSREPEVEQIVRRAWADRILVAVATERHDPHRIESIVLLGPPMRRD